MTDFSFSVPVVFLTGLTTELSVYVIVSERSEQVRENNWVWCSEGTSKKQFLHIH